MYCRFLLFICSSVCVAIDVHLNVLLFFFSTLRYSFVSYSFSIEFLFVVHMMNVYECVECTAQQKPIENLIIPIAEIVTVRYFFSVHSLHFFFFHFKVSIYHPLWIWLVFCVLTMFQFSFVYLIIIHTRPLIWVSIQYNSEREDKSTANASAQTHKHYIRHVR